MKKKLELEDEKEVEILKAVAQAWQSHSGSSRPANEYEALRQNFKSKPSCFKLEAMNKSSTMDVASAANWDFRQSLLDSYEIVTMTKRLERGVVLDEPFPRLDDLSQVDRKHKERKNSLRSLFNRSSSRRFNEAVIPPDVREDDTQF